VGATPLFRRVDLGYLERKLVLEGRPSKIRVVSGARVGAGDAARKALEEASRRPLGLGRRRLAVEGVKLYYYPYWIYTVEFSIRALPLWRLSRHEATLSVDGVNGHTTFADRPPSWEWREASGDELVKLFVDGRTADRLADVELPKLAALSLGGHIVSVKKRSRMLVYKPIWVVVAREEASGRRVAAIVDALTWGVGVVWYPRGRRMPEVFEDARRSGAPPTL